MISIVKWLLIILASGMVIYYVLKIISDGIHDIKKECQKNGYKGSEKFLFIISRILFGKDEERIENMNDEMFSKKQNLQELEKLDLIVKYEKRRKFGMAMGIVFLILFVFFIVLSFFTKNYNILIGTPLQLLGGMMLIMNNRK